MIEVELYKVFQRKLVAVVFVGILLFTAMSVWNDLSMYINKDKYNELQQEMECYEKYKGKLTDERIAEFGKEFKLDGVGYDYISNRFFVNGEQVPVKELYGDISFDIQFGYFKLWLFLFSSMTTNIKYVPIFISIAFSTLFTYDNQCGMPEILLSTKNGRKTCTKAKIIVAVGVSNLLYILILLISLIPFFLITHGIGSDTSIQMTPWLMASKVDMNYKRLLIHTIIIGFLEINVLVILTLCASIICKNPMTAMCVCLGILFVWRPDIMATHINNIIVNVITALTPYNIVDTVNLVKQDLVSVFGIQMSFIKLAELIYSILLIVGGVVFVKILSKNQKYFAI